MNMLSVTQFVDVMRVDTINVRAIASRGIKTPYIKLIYGDSSLRIEKEYDAYIVYMNDAIEPLCGLNRSYVLNTALALLDYFNWDK